MDINGSARFQTKTCCRFFFIWWWKYYVFYRHVLIRWTSLYTFRNCFGYTTWEAESKNVNPISDVHFDVQKRTRSARDSPLASIVDHIRITILHIHMNILWLPHIVCECVCVWKWEWWMCVCVHLCQCCIYREICKTYSFV